MNQFYQKIKNKTYYLIIVILTTLVLIVGPMIGSKFDGVGTNFPDSAIGWAIYLVTQIAMGVIGITVLYSFVRQAEINVASDPNYIKANKLCNRQYSKERKLRSYQQYMGSIYRRKSITVFLSTVLGVFTLGQAVITYDYMMLIVYLIIMTMQVVFGFIIMNNTEAYLTTEYLDYAIHTFGTKEEIDEYDRI